MRTRSDGRERRNAHSTRPAAPIKRNERRSTHAQARVPLPLKAQHAIISRAVASSTGYSRFIHRISTQRCHRAAHGAGDSHPFVASLDCPARADYAGDSMVNRMPRRRSIGRAQPERAGPGHAAFRAGCRGAHPRCLAGRLPAGFRHVAVPRDPEGRHRADQLRRVRARRHRVVFSMPLGVVAEQPQLQVVSLPASAVDWETTERYADSVRYARYVGDARRGRLRAPHRRSRPPV